MKMMQRINQFLLLLAIFTLSHEVTAAQNNFTIKTLKRSDWEFPVLEGGNSNVTERIHSLMLVNAFGLEFPALPPADPFQSLTILHDEQTRSIPSMSYQVLRNDERLFSVLFDGEGCGAYCEPFQQPLAFEAATGRLLTDSDVFTDAGRKALISELVKRNQKAIQNQIAKLQDKKPSDFASPDDLNAAQDMYKSCLDNWQSEDWRDWIGKMEFHPTELLFVHGRCSNHILQAVDDLGDLRNSFAYATLKPWLSDYGKRLLLGEKNESSPRSAPGQWLKGAIGDKTRISLYLIKPDHDYSNKETDIHGYYFYDRYRKPLKLQGKWKNGKFFLEEFDQKSIPQAIMTLENDSNGGLLGQWKSHNGKKTLEVKLDP